KRHPLEAKLVQPLAAAPTGRRRDRDLDQVAGAATVDDRARDRRPLRANSERVGRVLDVHPLVDAPVARAHGGSDEVARIRRVGPRRDRRRAGEEIVAHEKSWNTARVTSAPRTPPEATSTAEWS